MSIPGVGRRFDRELSSSTSRILVNPATPSLANPSDVVECCNCLVIAVVPFDERRSGHHRRGHRHGPPASSRDLTRRHPKLACRWSCVWPGNGEIHRSPNATAASELACGFCSDSPPNSLNSNPSLLEGTSKPSTTADADDDGERCDCLEIDLRHPTLSFCARHQPDVNEPRSRCNAQATWQDVSPPSRRPWWS